MSCAVNSKIATLEVGNIELAELLCDSLDHVLDSTLLRFAISSTEVKAHGYRNFTAFFGPHLSPTQHHTRPLLPCLPRFFRVSGDFRLRDRYRRANYLLYRVNAVQSRMCSSEALSHPRVAAEVLLQCRLRNACCSLQSLLTRLIDTENDQ